MSLAVETFYYTLLSPTMVHPPNPHYTLLTTDPLPLFLIFAPFRLNAKMASDSMEAKISVDGQAKE